METYFNTVAISIIGIIFSIALLLLVVVFVTRDRLGHYRKSFGLQKAALAYAGSLEKLRQTILPVRHSVFTYFEPIVWLYTASGVDILMTSNRKKDVRLWFQPATVLRGVHIVLDSKKNDVVLTNLMRKRIPPQRLDLEGDFSEHFRVFCNDGQEVIALQIIAPDVMAFILDNVMDVDIEIIEDQVGIIVRNAARSKRHLRNAVDLALHMDTLVRAATKVTSL